MTGAIESPPRSNGAAAIVQLTRRDAWIALALGAGLFVAYNANGREIGSYDSQPTKFAARELLVRHTLTLNHVVGAAPALAERPAFVLDRNGRYRSAYSPVPSVIAAGLAWPLWKIGLLDPGAPLAPNVIAKTCASAITALAVVIAYLTGRQRLGRVRALFLAVGLGLGTGFWYAVSQTLWVHETAILGLSLTMVAFAPPVPRLTRARALVIAMGLALAGVARPQLAPAIAVMLVALFARARRRDAVAGAIVVGSAAVALAGLYYHWFGHPLGAQVVNAAADNELHWTSGTFTASAAGLAGLLVSPNRGLIVFSPVVLVAAAGVVAAIADGWTSALRWCTLAALAQWLLYGSYSVWWAGHTYGPRYMLDVLPLLVPLAAAALARARVTVAGRAFAGAALAWSIVVAATGAFCYPHDAWNMDPTDVDRHHSRLWSWTDMQITRCWARGPSPQNFNLFKPEAFRSGGAR